MLMRKKYVCAVIKVMLDELDMIERLWIKREKFYSAEAVTLYSEYTNKYDNLQKFLSRLNFDSTEYYLKDLIIKREINKINKLADKRNVDTGVLRANLNKWIEYDGDNNVEIQID